MKQYKGHYLDEVFFFNEKEIDNQILKNRLRDLEQAVRVFDRNPSFESANYLSDKQEQLVKCHGYEWEEVEKLTAEMFRRLDLRNRE